MFNRLASMGNLDQNSLRIKEYQSKSVGWSHFRLVHLKLKCHLRRNKRGYYRPGKLVIEMPDVFSTEKRSEVMSLIRGKDTKIEDLVRKYLHRQGFRYRKNKKGIPGTPDAWFRKYNAAIFVHGCYWHGHKGCRLNTTPGTNARKWQKKFDDNVARDERHMKALSDLGIRVLVVWECQLKTKRMAEKTLPRDRKVVAIE